MENEFPKLGDFETVGVGFDLKGDPLPLSIDIDGNPLFQDSNSPYIGRFYLASGRRGIDQPLFFRGEIDEAGSHTVKRLKDFSNVPDEVVSVLIRVIRSKSPVLDSVINK